MTDENIRRSQPEIEELIDRVKQSEGRDPQLDCDIAVALQYVPDALVEHTNVRAHPSSRIIMLYDCPTRSETPTFIPMLTSSLDAVEKLRSWCAPRWTVDGVQARNGEYAVKAISESGASVQAVAGTEIRARLAVVLQAYERAAE